MLRVASVAASQRRVELSAVVRCRESGKLAAVLGASETCSQRRTLVNGFMRPPFRTAIPSTGLNGEPVNRDRFIIQYQGLVDALKDSVVVDELNILEPLTGFEPIRVSDLVFGMPDMVFPMPPHGIEHRLPELAELMRQVRAAGSWGSVQEFFQGNDAARASAGDFVYLPGLVFAAETSRTNKIAVDMIQSAHFHKPEHKAFLSNRVVFEEPDSPMLADVVGFAGQNVIICTDDDFGNRAAKVLATDAGTRPWYFARVEPGVQWLSFFGGGPSITDVIVTDESDVSLQSLAKAGLNPIPIEWEEPRKLGLTLRSVCLGLIFQRGGGGNTAKSPYFTQSSRRVVALDKKPKGDSGSPFWSQVRNYELPEFVHQPVPRYFPPMHGKAQVAPYTGRASEEPNDRDRKQSFGHKGTLPGQGGGEKGGGQTGWR
jgi:hypothetical protein